MLIIFTTAFLGMEFTEEGNGVVLHYVDDEAIGTEYIFQTRKEATAFYLACQRLCDEIKEEPLINQTAIFKEYIDKNIGNFNYTAVSY